MAGRNAKWNSKFRNFQIFEEKDNLERLIEIFEMSFPKLFVPFDFEPEFSEILVEWNAPAVPLATGNFRKFKLEFLVE